MKRRTPQVYRRRFDELTGVKQPGSSHQDEPETFWRLETATPITGPEVLWRWNKLEMNSSDGGAWCLVFTVLGGTLKLCSPYPRTECTAHPRFSSVASTCASGCRSGRQWVNLSNIWANIWAMTSSWAQRTQEPKACCVSHPHLKK